MENDSGYLLSVATVTGHHAVYKPFYLYNAYRFVWLYRLLIVALKKYWQKLAQLKIVLPGAIKLYCRQSAGMTKAILYVRHIVLVIIVPLLLSRMCSNRRSTVSPNGSNG